MLGMESAPFRSKYTRIYRQIQPEIQRQFMTASFYAIGR